MFHSIIIPAKGRDANLRLCLESLWTSSRICGHAANWEVVIATDSDTLPILQHPNRIAWIPPIEGPFNKNRLLNAGINCSNSDVLTFLDADCVAPPRFLESVIRLVADPTLTKLCYRVRRMNEADSAALLASGDIPAAFARYDDFHLAHEGYGEPDHHMPIHPRGLVFGNSHFSIRREVLADLRFDEEFQGRGYEDVHFNWQIWRRYFDSYKAEIVTDADHAVLNLANPPTVNEDWGPGDWNNRNFKRYKIQFGQWKREMRAKGVKV